MAGQLDFRGVDDADADLFLAGESEAKGTATAVGQGQAAGGEVGEVCGDDFPKFGRVVDLRHEVDFELGSCPAQNAIALGQFAEVVVIVAVVVVGGFEGCEETVKQVSGADFDRVHEGFVSQVHAHHFLFDELVDARDFLCQHGFCFVVGEDLLVDGFDFDGPLKAVFLVAFTGVEKAGEFLFFSGGGGPGGLEFYQALLALCVVALGAVGGEELTGFALAEVATGFDFGEVGVAGDLAVC